MSEKVCTLSIDHAIRIAKIIVTAPVARMPMITQLFQQAAVDLEGLEELIENSSLTSQTQLVDTEDFIRDLTTGRELTARGYLFTPDEFNRFCLERNLQPRLVKRHLYAAGYIEATQEANGKMNYSITVWTGETAQRRIAIKAQLSAPVRFCNFSPNGECKKMAGKGEQPLNDYTCRFRPSSLKYTDKSGLDGLQADKWYGNQGCIHPHAARRKMTFHFG